MYECTRFFTKHIPLRVMYLKIWSHEKNPTLFIAFHMTCYTSRYKLVKTSYLGALFSEWTLSLSPRLREARDKLETEKTRWREPGCETRCGTARHSYTDTTNNTTRLSAVFCANPVTEQCSLSVKLILTSSNTHKIHMDTP